MMDLEEKLGDFAYSFGPVEEAPLLKRGARGKRVIPSMSRISAVEQQ